MNDMCTERVVEANNSCCERTVTAFMCAQLKMMKLDAFAISDRKACLLFDASRDLFGCICLLKRNVFVQTLDI